MSSGVDARPLNNTHSPSPSSFPVLKPCHSHLQNPNNTRKKSPYPFPNPLRLPPNLRFSPSVLPRTQSTIMASPFPSTHHPFSSTLPHLQPSPPPTTISLNLTCPSSLSSAAAFKGCSLCRKMQKCMLSFRPHGIHRRVGSRISCSMNMTAGQSDEAGGRSSVEDIMDKARKLWDDSSPEPVKSFPWGRTLDNLVVIAFDLVVAVIKYSYLPVMAVVSLSEISYCMQEKKLHLIPFPLLVGVALAGYLTHKALDVSPFLKEKAKVPWHLIFMGILFTLIKLPGPYYRYWGRILIPHFANGGILRTLWFAYLWYRQPRMGRSSGLPEQNGI